MIRQERARYMSSKKRSQRASVAVARLSGSSVNSISRRSSTSVLSIGVVMFWKGSTVVYCSTKSGSGANDVGTRYRNLGLEG